MNIHIDRFLNPAFVALVMLLALAGNTAKAQQLPEASRTVFKCKAGGKVVYSDSPCLGAERIEVEPTRGVDAASGRKATGNDVMRERYREQFADAVRPLTGMDAKQLEVHGRRMKLQPAAQRECAGLDKSLQAAETEEVHAVGGARETVQERLYQLRKRSRELHC